MRGSGATGVLSVVVFWGALFLIGVRLRLLVGHYAQAHYLGGARGRTLTDTVRAFRDYLPDTIPLPHPSPRNQLWFRSNPWFEAELVPVLRERVAAALADGI